MNTYGVYRVKGRRQYRGHEPGTTFEANLAPAVEQRAIDRGDIELLRRITPSLVPGSYRLRNWPPPDDTPAPSSTEAPTGASRL